MSEEQPENDQRGKNGWRVSLWAGSETRPKLFTRENAKVLGVWAYVLVSAFMQGYLMLRPKAQKSPPPVVEEVKPKEQGADSTAFKALQQSVFDMRTEIGDLKKKTETQEKETANCKTVMLDFCEELEDEIPNIQPVETRRAIRNATRKAKERFKPISKANELYADTVPPGL